MSESHFVKTVAFGGYEKTEVMHKFEYLYSQFFDLKNELRETKLLLDAYKKNTDESKAFENLLSGEKAKLTQIQVQNETLSIKLKATEDENKRLTGEIEALNAKITELNDIINENNVQLAAFQSDNDSTALGKVFIEAQKSVDMLVGSAKDKAAQLDADAKKAAENTITEANDTASMIIYQAETEAAKTIANAQNKANEMDVASNNLKAVMLSEVNKMSSEIAALRSVYEEFLKSGNVKIAESESILNYAQQTLTNGGVPQFQQPEHIEPDLPEKPLSSAERQRAEEEKEKKKQELEKLQMMAKSLGSKQPANEEDSKDIQTEQPAPKKKLDLSSLASQAAALKKK